MERPETEWSTLYTVFKEKYNSKIYVICASISHYENSWYDEKVAWMQLVESQGTQLINIEVNFPKRIHQRNNLAQDFNFKEKLL